MYVGVGDCEGAGWYILGENQQNHGPYAFSELRGKWMFFGAKLRILLMALAFWNIQLVVLLFGVFPPICGFFFFWISVVLVKIARWIGLLRFIYLAWTEHFLNGYLSKNSLLWSEGRSDWQELSSIPELMTAISELGADSSGSGEWNIFAHTFVK